VLIGRRYFERGRVQTDALFESIRGLMHGFKELKLNRVKQERYFREVLLASEQAVLLNTKRGSTIVTAAANYGDLLSFFVIGAISFVFLNYHAISSARLEAVIMVLLYITSPVAMLLNSIPQLTMANVSLRSITRLFAELAEEEASDTVERIADWHSVHLTAVTFAYENADGRFTLGPVNMDVHKGEITFIAGGNGSGKSTLGKLLALHYAPKSGEIRFGATQVDNRSLNSCRQSVGAIFADYHLFDRLLGSLTSQQQTLIERYLKDLQLERKVSVADGKFSTLTLSEGQKRRVALLVALLEDRDMYVFDEWAADQDPAFKRIFYCEILPLLRAKGKAVVVISHDDRYFHVADRLFVMEDGRMVQAITAESEGRYADAEVPAVPVAAV
jgi:putative ATP-binding cassette transporter